MFGRGLRAGFRAPLPVRRGRFTAHAVPPPAPPPPPPPPPPPSGTDYYSGASRQTIYAPSGVYTYGTTLRFDMGNVLTQVVSYQWYRSDGTAEPVAISGATSSTYTTVLADQGKIVSCVATGSISGSLPAAGQYIF